MKIVLHGGDCCGIKHIHGLGSYPDINIAARKARKMSSFGQLGSGGHNDMRSKNRYRSYDFFNRDAPMETYRKRLERLIDFIKLYRGHGIIEVVLSHIQYSWKPILEGIGFKAVSSGKNSNSGSTITVYHLVH